MQCLTINGQNRTGEIGEQIRQQAEKMRTTSLPHAERAAAVLALRNAQDEQAFLVRFLSLLREDYSVRLDTIEPLPRPGFLGVILAFPRRLLWRLLRPHIELLAWRQNAINANLTHALEFLLLASKNRHESSRFHNSSNTAPGPTPSCQTDTAAPSSEPGKP